MTLEKAAAETGVSRAALRTWYRAGQIPSRLVDGPHGPQRLVPLAVVAERAEASPRLRKTTERRLGDEAQLEILRHRVDQLELRLAALERRHARKTRLAPQTRASPAPHRQPASLLAPPPVATSPPASEARNRRQTPAISFDHESDKSGAKVVRTDRRRESRQKLIGG